MSNKKKTKANNVRKQKRSAKNRLRRKATVRSRIRAEGHLAGIRAKIRKFGDIALDSVCSEVTNMESLSFIDDMRKILGATKNGVGMAANQIGETKRVFVTRASLETKRIKVFINPVMVDHDEETEIDYEGCLSYPKMNEKIERWNSITIKYVDEKFIKHQETFNGFMARIVQHELEHLDGCCQIGKAWKSKQVSI